MQKSVAIYLFPLLTMIASPAFSATEFSSSFSDTPAKASPPPQAAKVSAPDEAPITPPPSVPEMVDVVTPVPLTPDEIELLGSANSGTPSLPATQAPSNTPATPTAAQKPADIALRDMLKHVYETHPQLAAEREKLKALDESVAIAVSDFRPSAIADYSKGRERQDGSSGRWDYRDTTSKGLTVTQPVFSGFSGVAGLQAAKQRMKAGRADLIALEQQVLFNAIVAYTDMVEKQSMLLLAQNNVDVLTKQRDAVTVRFDVGELTKTDVAQAEARLASAVASEQQAVGNLAIARANYIRATDSEPPAEIVMPDVPTGLPASASEAVAMAKAANPILLAAKQREKAFTSDISTRQGALLPSVNVEATMRRSEGGNVFASRYENDALTLNVRVPLYQSGAEWARLRQARNSAQQAKFDTMDTSLAVSQDVSSAWQNYTTAESIIISTEKAAKASELALEGVKQENEFGVRTILDVLDAEQEYLDTKVNLVRATRNHKIQAYRLLASVGKLTAEQLGLPVQYHDAKENYNNVKYQLLGW